ncbi:ABC transporter substrate-binding protein [Brachybacterium sp. NPDC056505]|uniref:ABC transporter substrate-binding protein n=1 Tax=Brachybacterium sp. NPDC056505 TaxID=3345843 RepID=UPI00366AEE8D
MSSSLRARPRRLAAAASALAAGALTLALGACGTTDVSSSSADSAASDGGSAAAAISKDCAQDTTATSDDPVSITDGVGRTVELEKPAQRVVVLEWQQVEDALSQCVQPVGVSEPDGFRTWDSAETLPEGVEDVGTRGEPDLDTVLSLDPDLVVVEAFSKDDEIIGQIEKTGVPVLATLGADPDDPIGNMKGVFSMIGEATGRSERADAVLEEFDDHLAAAKKEVQDADLETKEFLFFDGWVEGGNLTIRPYTDGALFTELGKELGLTSAWDDDLEEAYGTGGVSEEYGLTQTDVEGLTAVGDANLFYANDEGTGEGSYIDEMQKNDIWSSLPAVKAGRAHAFPPRIWGAGGPRSNEQAIDAFVDGITQG